MVLSSLSYPVQLPSGFDGSVLIIQSLKVFGVKIEKEASRKFALPIQMLYVFQF